MFSVEDFVTKYEHYTNDELLDIHSSIDTYSAEAQKAFYIVLSRKGGLEYLIKHQSEKKILSDEIQRVRTETAKLNSPGVDASFAKTLITSTILSPEQLDQIIDAAHVESEWQREDKEIKPRTIFGSIIGGAIAMLAGGILWGLQLVYSNKIFVIFFIGLVLLCYGIIKLSTNQSKKNTVVAIATIIAVAGSLLIGQLLYRIIGYKG